MADTNCIKTTVKNLTGKVRVFGFLGKHGMRLAIGEVVSVPGHLAMELAAHRDQRKFKALEAALLAGTLEIQSSPAEIIDDSSLGAVRLAADTGSLSVVAPCWE